MFKLFNASRPNKKASLSLSINAIVMIVLALTLLGLGLGFIRGMFKQITTTTTTVQEQVKEQILDDLRTGNKKLSFPSTNVNLDRGSITTLAFGVKNTKGLGNLVFKIDVGVTGAKGNSDVTEDMVDPPINFFYEEGPFTLGAADSEVYAFQITDLANAVEVYKVKIKIIELKEDGTEVGVYSEKTFFLNVG